MGGDQDHFKIHILKQYFDNNYCYVIFLLINKRVMAEMGLEKRNILQEEGIKQQWTFHLKIYEH